jgi:hypothetical protein
VSFHVAGTWLQQRKLIGLQKYDQVARDSQTVVGYLPKFGEYLEDLAVMAKNAKQKTASVERGNMEGARDD